MTDRTSDGRLITTPEGGVMIDFEWYYDRPAEAVWAALTEPERLALWIADAEVELRIGGRYRLLWRNEGHGSIGAPSTARAHVERA